MEIMIYLTVANPPKTWTALFGSPSWPKNCSVRGKFIWIFPDSARYGQHWASLRRRQLAGAVEARAAHPLLTCLPSLGLDMLSEQGPSLGHMGPGRNALLNTVS